MDYKVAVSNVYAADSEEKATQDLEKRVKSLIEKGYKPIGGVCVTVSQYDLCYAYQAMLKE